MYAGAHEVDRAYVLIFYILSGVIQGCPLSVVLLNMLVNVWTSAIKKRVPGVQPESFADAKSERRAAARLAARERKRGHKTESSKHQTVGSQHQKADSKHQRIGEEWRGRLRPPLSCSL